MDIVYESFVDRAKNIIVKNKNKIMAAASLAALAGGLAYIYNDLKTSSAGISSPNIDANKSNNKNDQTINNKTISQKNKNTYISSSPAKYNETQEQTTFNPTLERKNVYEKYVMNPEFQNPHGTEPTTPMEKLQYSFEKAWNNAKKDPHSLPSIIERNRGKHPIVIFNKDIKRKNPDFHHISFF